ncbi:hypothetical protein FXO38_02544 [Capsicum annuum]|nr:hypothetical protein FXO38_02544 [Capsicum annuum]
MKRFRFLRKLSNSNEKPFIAVLALAAAGFFSSNETTSSRTSILVSLPDPDPLKDRLVRSAADQSQVYIFPSCFARRIGLDSPGNVKKEGSGEDDDDGEKKHKCCNCFGRDTIANAAATVGPAVVNFSVSRSFHGLSAGRSIGSGTIKDADGTILTCAHVVDFQGLRISSKGKIKSTTPLPTAKLGTSNKRLRPGDWVVAMGCPLSLQNTITAGIVSCVDRKSSDLGLGGMRREYLQTDCAINA